MDRDYQAIVLGMGPAGMAAAMELAGHGIKTAIMDQGQSPGGQVYRQPPREFKRFRGDDSNPRKLAGRALLQEFGSTDAGLTVITGATIWGSFDSHSLSLLRDGKLNTLSFEKLIICEGARERMIPFPGWTLPGVFSVGGLQKMITNQGVIPGRRILIAGSGPLLMAAGANLIKAGGQIAGLYEASSPLDILPVLPQLFRQKGLLREALCYLSALASKGAFARPGWVVTRAHGEKRVKAATICKVDRNWRPLAGTERTVEVDAVAVGYGFQAMGRLVRLFGCRQEYDSSAGSMKPATDRYQRTSRPEVYAAGDGAGIGGAAMAEIQGRIAGLHAACALDGITGSEFDQLVRPWLERRVKLGGYARVFEQGVYAQRRHIRHHGPGYRCLPLRRRDRRENLGQHR